MAGTRKGREGRRAQGDARTTRETRRGGPHGLGRDGQGVVGSGRIQGEEEGRARHFAGLPR